MFLILFGDPRLVPQERLLLKSTYDLLWNVAYQHNLNNTAGHKKRQAFISQQVDSFDESDPDHGEDTLFHQEKDDSS